MWALGALGWMGLCLVGCAEQPQEPEALATQHQEVIRGTREPSLVSMTEGQKMAIGYLHQGGSRSAFFCSGTVIAPRLVATARHCTEDGAPLGFALGLEPGPNNTSVAAEGIYNHPQLDVSVVVLSEDIVARAPGLTPITFNRQAMGAQDSGQRVEVGGYGETRDFSRTGRWFGALDIAQVEATSFIVYGDGQRGFCFGDSGGPVLMQRNGQPSLVAIISATQDESCLGYGFVERLDVLSDWLDTIASRHGGWGNQASPQDPPPEQGDNSPQEGSPGGPCQSSNSYCFNQTRVWCGQDGYERRQDCQAQGLGCGFDAQGEAACLDPNTPPPQAEPEPSPEPEPTPQEPAPEQGEPAPQEGGQWAEEGEGAGWAEDDTSWADDPSQGAGWADEEEAAPLVATSRGCSAAPGRPVAPAWGLLALLGLVWRRRRAQP